MFCTIYINLWYQILIYGYPKYDMLKNIIVVNIVTSIWIVRLYKIFLIGSTIIIRSAQLTQTTTHVCPWTIEIYYTEIPTTLDTLYETLFKI